MVHGSLECDHHQNSHCGIMENAGAVQLCLGRLWLEMYAKIQLNRVLENMVIVGKDDELLMVYISGGSLECDYHQ